MLEHGMIRQVVAASNSGGINDGKAKVYQINSIGNYTTAIDGSIIDTETAFNPSATTGYDAFTAGTNYSGSTGYISGGWLSSGTVLNQHFGIRYATDTSASFGALVTAHTYGGRGVNFANSGYTAGGGSNTSPSTVYSFVQKTTFATDGISHTTAELPSPRCISSGVTDNVSGVGYFLGGYYSGSTNAINKFTLSTESTIAHSFSLSRAKYEDNASMESASSGYMFGGYATVQTTEIERIAFSTGTTSVIAATIGAAVSATAGGNSSKFFVHIVAASQLSPIQKFIPSTDSISNISLSLSEARASPYCCNA